MSTINSADRTTGVDRTSGALPRLGGSPARGFGVHAVLALAALLFLNWLVVTEVPLAIKGIGSSYLIFFYHFPAAINVFVFYGALMGASVLYLKTKDPIWDRRARAAAEVGILCNAVLLVTGSTWAKAAWNAWWVWNDPRLMSAAVMTLIYIGYLMLHGAIEEPARRRQVAGVYGSLAFLNIPMVHYSIKLFGQASHPMKFDALSDASVVATRWYGVAAFFVFYLLIYRWTFDRKSRADRLEDSLGRIRRIEERGATS